MRVAKARDAGAVSTEKAIGGGGMCKITAQGSDIPVNLSFWFLAHGVQDPEPEGGALSGLLVQPSLPMDSWRCDEGAAL